MPLNWGFFWFKLLIMWLKKNYKTIIRLTYIIPILFAAGVSIAHVITWYGITNPMSWAIYLSVGVEIAALSALAGMTAKMSKWVYVPFFIVTFIQLIGNVFFSFQYIDVNSIHFKSWVELVGPLFEGVGMVTPGNVVQHKQWLALLSGGLIPMISLSFLHLLISFNDEEYNKQVITDVMVNKVDIGPEIETIEPEVVKEVVSDRDDYVDSDQDSDQDSDHDGEKGSEQVGGLDAEEEVVVEPSVEEVSLPEHINPIKSHKSNFERVGFNKIIKNEQPNQIYYKK